MTVLQGMESESVEQFLFLNVLVLYLCTLIVVMQENTA